MVLVGNSDYLDEREVHYLRAFLGMRVSGLILISQGPSENAAAEIDAWDARVVLLQRAARRSTKSRWSSTTSAAPPGHQHLLDHGHRTWPASAAWEPPLIGDPVNVTWSAGGGMEEAGRPT